MALIENPPANAGDTEMQVRSVGQEDSMEEEMATHSSILAQEIPMDRGAWHVQLFVTQGL